MHSVRTIAFYLPQFHTIPENDVWWGKGFTEWTNVTKSEPKFKGHYQPHLPSELGFYNLEHINVMHQQAQLAKQYGLGGFCFYHYWFNGKLLLEKPLNNWYQDKTINFPYCICWANENWTRRWDGREQERLISQQHSAEDDANHIKYLMPFFKDDRYIKIDGKPIFLMYRSELHPNIIDFAGLCRKEAEKEGFPGIYLIRVENFLKNINPHTHHFDACAEFAPDFDYRAKPNFMKTPDKWIRKLANKINKSDGLFNNSIRDYSKLVRVMINKATPNYKFFRCITPSWDNSPRRVNKATIYINNSPQLFEEWATWALQYTINNFNGNERILFINAWNEWAEGAHLEPDQRYGYAYLQALKNALDKTKKL